MLFSDLKYDQKRPWAVLECMADNGPFCNLVADYLDEKLYI